MTGPRITLAALPDFTPFNYSQAPLGQERVVAQLDHGRIDDGRWHRVSDHNAAHYRCVDRFYQQVQVVDEPAAGVVQSMLKLLEHAGPLQTDDIVEVVVRDSGRGFEMTSELILLSDGARFMEFTPDAWNNAYQRLLSLEDGFDPDSAHDV